MGDQYTQPIKQSFYRLMQVGIPWDVGVAVHRLNRGDEGQLPKDLLTPHIARMKDEIYPRECIVDLGAE